MFDNDNLNLLFGLSQLPQSAYEFGGKAFTTQELWCKISEKINILIEHFKYLDKTVTGETEAMNKKLEYLLGQGLTEQVSKKILELIDNGTIINENLFQELNNKIQQVSDDLISGLDENKQAIQQSENKMDEGIQENRNQIQQVSEHLTNELNKANSKIDEKLTTQDGKITEIDGTVKDLYKTFSIDSFNTINVLGDSITERNVHSDYYYHDYLKEYFKASKVNNYGVSSTTVARRKGRTDSFCERYNNMDNSADLIIVMGGINDMGNSIMMGDFYSRSQFTYYGALHELCSGLKRIYGDKPMFFITPVGQEGFFSEPNARAYTTRDYVNAMIEVCNYYSIPVLDMYAFGGISPQIAENKAMYTTDGLHWNAKGHKLIGERIARGISFNTYYGNMSDIVPIESIVGMNFTALGSKYDFYHLTCIIENDCDFALGCKVDTTLIAEIQKGVTQTTTSTGGTLFADNSGDVGNGKYVSQPSEQTTYTQTVEGSKLTISSRHQINAMPKTKFIKVPIIIQQSALPFAIKIWDITLKVNGNNKKIRKIGGFFPEDTFEIS